jgi:hypothetical protein
MSRDGGGLFDLAGSEVVSGSEVVCGDAVPRDPSGRSVEFGGSIAPPEDGSGATSRMNPTPMSSAKVAAINRTRGFLKV